MEGLEERMWLDYRVSSLMNAILMLPVPKSDSSWHLWERKLGFPQLTFLIPFDAGRGTLVSPVLAGAGGKDCESDVTDSAGRMELLFQSRLGGFP